MQITWKGSPNFNDPTYRNPIDRIILHWFGVGTLDSANTRFQNSTNQVSAHYGISDSTVYQWVKEEDVAWHAGNFLMNQRSIGIEHDATTTKNATESTYLTSATLVSEICKRYNIPCDRNHILKHSQVVATQCCGTLDIDRIISMAKDIIDSPDENENLLKENLLLKSNLNTLQVKYDELEDKYMKDMAEKQLHIESLQKSGAEVTQQLILARQATESAKATSNSLESKIEALETKVKDLEEKITLSEENITNLAEQLSDANGEVLDLQKKLTENLKGYTKWQLLMEFLFRR